MKKIFMGTVVLVSFSAAIILFQMSCQKSANAQTGTYVLPAATNSTLGGVIVGNGLSVTGNGTLSVTASASGLTQLNKLIFKKVINTNGTITSEIWTANYDGTNATKVAITLPSGTAFDDGMVPRMSPDGTKIFFTATSSVGTTGGGDLYSCTSTGGSVTRIIDKGGTNNGIQIGGVY